MAQQLITKGYGPHRMLITLGYSIFKVIEKIIEIISRVIPIKRIPFEMKIPVVGDLSLDFREKAKVTGDLFYPKFFSIYLKGDLFRDFQSKVKVSGDFALPFLKDTLLIGDLEKQIQTRLPLLGDLILPFKEIVKVRGKKDLRELAWLILEDDEEE